MSSILKVYFQDPLHPLGMWDNPHVSTDNFYWRVINGSGAFGPGGFLSRLINDHACDDDAVDDEDKVMCVILTVLY